MDRIAEPVQDPRLASVRVSDDERAYAAARRSSSAALERVGEQTPVRRKSDRAVENVPSWSTQSFGVPARDIDKLEAGAPRVDAADHQPLPIGRPRDDRLQAARGAGRANRQEPPFTAAVGAFHEDSAAVGN